jgi:hypothetical protein
VPAKLLRDVLAKMGGDSWSRKKLREELKLVRQETTPNLTRLKSEGHLEASDHLRGWYRAGPAAPRLINVRFLKRIDRARQMPLWRVAAPPPG